MTGLLMLPKVLLAEVAKLKRTLALGMAVLAPLVIVILYFLVGYAGGSPITRAGTDVWQALARNTVQLWSILMLPLYITLETSLLAGLEHSDRNWKFLMALPVPKWTIYIAKLIVTVALVCLAHLVLVGGTLVSGVMLRLLAPGLHLTALPVQPLAEPLAKISAAILLAVSIQHWVSLRWPSFIAAMGFGMCAMVAGFLAVNSAEWGPWFPWSLTLHTLRPRPEAIISPMVFSVAGAAVVAAVGAWEFSRRDVA